LILSQPSASDPTELDDKITRVMAYLQNSVVWGELTTKKAIRISTWLRTPMAPQYLNLHSAQVLSLDGNSTGRPRAFKQMLVPVSLIQGFHIMPPERDPVDYDEQEQNRIMQPVTALAGPFHFVGNIRISVHTDIEHFLDTSKEAFVSMYDVEISQSAQPAAGVVRVPMAIVRRERVIFAT
jgi:hypothetical protein